MEVNNYIKYVTQYVWQSALCLFQKKGELFQATHWNSLYKYHVKGKWMNVTLHVHDLFFFKGICSNKNIINHILKSKLESL